MKSLRDIGKLLVVHPETNGELVRIKCTCGKVHLLHALPTTRYVDCLCGKRVKRNE
jgi:hypothetical protein